MSKSIIVGIPVNPNDPIHPYADREHRNCPKCSAGSVYVQCFHPADRSISKGYSKGLLELKCILCNYSFLMTTNDFVNDIPTAPPDIDISISGRGKRLCVAAKAKGRRWWGFFCRL